MSSYKQTLYLHGQQISRTSDIEEKQLQLSPVMKGAVGHNTESQFLSHSNKKLVGATDNQLDDTMKINPGRQTQIQHFTNMPMIRDEIEETDEKKSNGAGLSGRFTKIVDSSPSQRKSSVHAQVVIVKKKPDLANQSPGVTHNFRNHSNLIEPSIAQNASTLIKELQQQHLLARQPNGQSMMFKINSIGTSPREYFKNIYSDGPIGETERADSLQDSSRMILDGFSQVGLMKSKINSRMQMGPLNFSSKKLLIEQVKAEVQATTQRDSNVKPSQKTSRLSSLNDYLISGRTQNLHDLKIGHVKQKVPGRILNFKNTPFIRVADPKLPSPSENQEFKTKQLAIQQQAKLSSRVMKSIDEKMIHLQPVYQPTTNYYTMNSTLRNSQTKLSKPDQTGNNSPPQLSDERRGDVTEAKSPFQMPFRMKHESNDFECPNSGLTNKKSNISRLITENIIIEDEPDQVLQPSIPFISNQTIPATTLHKLDTGWDTSSESKLNLQTISQKFVGLEIQKLNLQASQKIDPAEIIQQKKRQAQLWRIKHCPRHIQGLIQTQMKFNDQQKQLEMPQVEVKPLLANTSGHENSTNIQIMASTPSQTRSPITQHFEQSISANYDDTLPKIARIQPLKVHQIAKQLNKKAQNTVTADQLEVQIRKDTEKLDFKRSNVEQNEEAMRTERINMMHNYTLKFDQQLRSNLQRSKLDRNYQALPSESLWGKRQREAQIAKQLQDSAHKFQQHQAEQRRARRLKKKGVFSESATLDFQEYRKNGDHQNGIVVMQQSPESKIRFNESLDSMNLQIRVSEGIKDQHHYLSMDGPVETSVGERFTTKTPERLVSEQNKRMIFNQEEVLANLPIGIHMQGQPQLAQGLGTRSGENSQNKEILQQSSDPLLSTTNRHSPSYEAQRFHPEVKIMAYEEEMDKLDRLSIPSQISRIEVSYPQSYAQSYHKPLAPDGKQSYYSKQRQLFHQEMALLRASHQSNQQVISSLTRKFEGLNRTKHHNVMKQSLATLQEQTCFDAIKSLNATPPNRSRMSLNRNRRLTQSVTIEPEDDLIQLKNIKKSLNQTNLKANNIKIELFKNPKYKNYIVTSKFTSNGRYQEKPTENQASRMPDEEMVRERQKLIATDEQQPRVSRKIEGLDIKINTGFNIDQSAISKESKLGLSPIRIQLESPTTALHIGTNRSVVSGKFSSTSDNIGLKLGTVSNTISKLDSIILKKKAAGTFQSPSKQGFTIRKKMKESGIEWNKVNHISYGVNQPKVLLEVDGPSNWHLIGTTQTEEDVGEKEHEFAFSGMKREKQDICKVRAIAYQLLHSIYQSDPRILVDEDQQLQENISCANHGSNRLQKEAQMEKVTDRLDKINKFYDTSTLQGKLNVRQKIHQGYLKLLMNENEPAFAQIRERMLQVKPLSEVTFEEVVQLNPHIFLREPEIDNEEQSPIAMQSALDHQSHHLLSLNPNRKLVVKKSFLQQLVEGIMKLDRESQVNSLQNRQEKLTNSPNRSSRRRTSLIQRAFEIESIQSALRYFFTSQVNKATLFAKAANVDTQIRMSQSKSNLDQKNSIGLNPPELGNDSKDDDNEFNEAFEQDKLFSFDLLNSQHVLKKKYVEQKIFSELKHQVANPTGAASIESQLVNKLEQNGNVPKLLFTQIKNGKLALVDQFLSNDEIEALATYIEKKTSAFEMELQGLNQNMLSMQEEEKRLIEMKKKETYIHELTIDDCGLKDQQFARLLNGLGTQHSLRSIIYKNNEFGQKSLDALRDLIMLTKPVQSRLSFRQYHQLEILKLSNLSFSNSEVQSELIKLIAEAQAKKPLKQIKLSGFILSAQNVETIKQGIFEHYQIEKLDLSYCTIKLELLADLLRELALDYEEKGGLNLKNLNLSYMQLNGDSAVIEQIAKSISKVVQKSQMLLHLDLSGMKLREHIRWIIESVKNADHQTLVSLHLHDNEFDTETKMMIAHELQIPESHMDNIEGSVFAPKPPSEKMKSHASRLKKLSDHFENSLIKTRIELINHDLNHELLESIRVFQAETGQGFRRTHEIQDPLLISRKLGHPELIFRESDQDKTDFCFTNHKGLWSLSLKSDQCYVCQGSRYFQVFFNPKRVATDYQPMINKEIRQLIFEIYQLDSPKFRNSKRPILLSSINDWVLSKMANVKLFAGLLEEQLSEEVKFMLEHEMRGEESESSESDSLLDTPKTIENDGKSFAQKRQTNKILVKQITMGSIRAGSKMSMLGSKEGRQTISPILQKQQMGIQKQWRSLLLNSQKYREEIVSVNFPLAEDVDDKVFVFAGFVKPGKHVIVIYDPPTDNLYFKHIIVEVRKQEIVLDRTYTGF